MKAYRVPTFFWTPVEATSPWSLSQPGIGAHTGNGPHYLFTFPPQPPIMIVVFLEGSAGRPCLSLVNGLPFTPRNGPLERKTCHADALTFSLEMPGFPFYASSPDTGPGLLVIPSMSSSCSPAFLDTCCRQYDLFSRPLFEIVFLRSLRPAFYTALVYGVDKVPHFESL